ncbi:MAG: hypothetical protein Q9201_001899 [Fulgogasparrea decipioides]
MRYVDSWLTLVNQQESAPSSLRTILLSLVISEATRGLVGGIKEVQLHSGGPQQHRELTDDDEVIFANTDSINGANKMRLLRNHDAATGYRNANRVIIPKGTEC